MAAARLQFAATRLAGRAGWKSHAVSACGVPGRMAGSVQCMVFRLYLQLSAGHAMVGDHALDGSVSGQ
jgi:hypothetical protein